MPVAFCFLPELVHHAILTALCMDDVHSSVDLHAEAYMGRHLLLAGLFLILDPEHPIPIVRLFRVLAMVPQGIGVYVGREYAHHILEPVHTQAGTVVGIQDGIPLVEQLFTESLGCRIVGLDDDAVFVRIAFSIIFVPVNDGFVVCRCELGMLTAPKIGHTYAGNEIIIVERDTSLFHNRNRSFPFICVLDNT